MTPTDTETFMKLADTTCDGSEPIESTVISRNELKHANASALDKIRRRSNRPLRSQRNPENISRQYCDADDVVVVACSSAA